MKFLLLKADNILNYQQYSNFRNYKKHTKSKVIFS